MLMTSLVVVFYLWLMAEAQFIILDHICVWSGPVLPSFNAS